MWIKFICEWITGKNIITELCKNYKISRPTANKLIYRFEKQVFEGLKEKSRVQNKQSVAITKNIDDGILKLKKKHPR